jgi:hypothetical protein
MILYYDGFKTMTTFFTNALLIFMRVQKSLSIAKTCEKELKAQSVFLSEPVAFNSIAAMESIAYGVPAFVSVPCAASPLALTDLSQISKPFYPDEMLVKKHCCSLAYGQFTGEEISNGTAWKILNQ